MRSPTNSWWPRIAPCELKPVHFFNEFSIYLMYFMRREVYVFCSDIADSRVVARMTPTLLRRSMCLESVLRETRLPSKKSTWKILFVSRNMIACFVFSHWRIHIYPPAFSWGLGLSLHFVCSSSRYCLNFLRSIYFLLRPGFEVSWSNNISLIAERSFWEGFSL